MTTMTSAARGGAWLTSETATGTVMTPERLTDEHKMIGRTAA